MMHDRHAVLRLATQTLAPLLLLTAALALARMGHGLGGAVGAGLILASTLVLFAMVFGFGALSKVLPPLVVRALSGFALVLLLCISLIGPQVLEVTLAQAQAASPIELRLALLEVAGAAMALLIACGVLQAVQAIGGRARPLEDAGP